MADYVPSNSGGALLIAGQNGVSSSAGINMDWTAIEPRVGATWKVFGSEKTVLRGGYALFHDSAWSQGATAAVRSVASRTSCSAPEPVLSETTSSGLTW